LRGWLGLWVLGLWWLSLRWVIARRVERVLLSRLEKTEVERYQGWMRSLIPVGKFELRSRM
jgi:hypothetical protein